MRTTLHAQHHVLHTLLQRLTDGRLVDFILLQLLPVIRKQLLLAGLATSVSLLTVQCRLVTVHLKSSGQEDGSSAITALRHASAGSSLSFTNESAAYRCKTRCSTRYTSAQMAPHSIVPPMTPRTVHEHVHFHGSVSRTGVTCPPVTPSSLHCRIHANTLDSSASSNDARLSLMACSMEAVCVCSMHT
jgi:hypothetical protein